MSERRPSLLATHPCYSQLPLPPHTRSFCFHFHLTPSGAASLGKSLTPHPPSQRPSSLATALGTTCNPDLRSSDLPFNESVNYGPYVNANFAGMDFATLDLPSSRHGRWDTIPTTARLKGHIVLEDRAPKSEVPPATTAANLPSNRAELLGSLPGQPCPCHHNPTGHRIEPHEVRCQIWSIWLDLFFHFLLALIISRHLLKSRSFTTSASKSSTPTRPPQPTRRLPLPSHKGCVHQLALSSIPIKIIWRGLPLVAAPVQRHPAC